MTKQELAEQIKNVYLEIFPLSACVVSKSCLGDDYFVSTYLGNKETFSNGICQNDQSNAHYLIQDDAKGFEVTCSNGVAIKVNPKDRYLAMSREKVAFRLKKGDEKKIVADMKKHFRKHAEAIITHKENIYNGDKVSHCIDAIVL